MYGEWAHMIGPADYEPDYQAYIEELESMATMMADVGSYDDWFVDTLPPVVTNDA